MILRRLNAPVLSHGVGETGLVIRCDREQSVAIQHYVESQLESNVFSTYTAHITIPSKKRKSGFNTQVLFRSAAFQSLKSYSKCLDTKMFTICRLSPDINITVIHRWVTY